ncbi:uncharacterized protein LOC132617997 [Lycium barbarum]|uniref:uncharacterized protein LOC132617997 n=1 Tax=Lycium barbarum TaxID=112863 RepID=UPI00293F6C8A|nr:uncharacterized protein LOC132617997 [Lycium barbarum]
MQKSIFLTLTNEQGQPPDCILKDAKNTSKLSYSSLLGSINPMSRSRVYQALAEEDIEADAKGNDVDLSLILINVKHITKLLGEQGREEYVVLDLKHKVICFLLERTKLCTNNT